MCPTATAPMTLATTQATAPRPRPYRGPKEQPALVGAVGDQSAVRAEQQDRQELRGCDQSQQRARSRELQHQPGLRHHLHPRANQADRLSREVQAEIRHG